MFHAKESFYVPAQRGVEGVGLENHGWSTAAVAEKLPKPVRELGSEPEGGIRRCQKRFRLEQVAKYIQAVSQAGENPKLNDTLETLKPYAPLDWVVGLFMHASPRFLAPPASHSGRLAVHSMHLK